MSQQSPRSLSIVSVACFQILLQARQKGPIMTDSIDFENLSDGFTYLVPSDYRDKLEPVSSRQVLNDHELEISSPRLFHKLPFFCRRSSGFWFKWVRKIFRISISLITFQKKPLSEQVSIWPIQSIFNFTNKKNCNQWTALRRIY